MKRIISKAVCLLCAGALALTAAGCSKSAASSSTSASSEASVYGSASDYDYQNFAYSDGLDENGYWSGIRALDYVTLPDNVSALPLSKADIEPTETEIQTQIDTLLNQYATTQNITGRAAQSGDTVNIDYSGAVDGVAFTGGTATGYDLTLGSHTFIDGFEDQIIGHNIGDTFDVTVTFPDGYGDSTDAEGNTIEGGLTLEAAKLMPSQIKVEAQRDLFKGAKLGDIITFNPRNAYPESDGEMAALLKVEKDQLADYTGDFSFQITQISHFVPAENNEELWKAVYGQDADIKDEAAFRQTIAEGVRQQLVQDEDFKFMQDVRKHCEKKVGELTFANDILKRVMLQNNQDKGEKFVEENYDRSIKELTWHLIKNKLVEQTGVKVEEQDIREIARQSTRAQFAQYGMGNIPDELIEKYADEMLKKRENVEPLVEAAIDRKLAVALKEVVKLDTKEISLEDFNKMLEA